MEPIATIGLDLATSVFKVHRTGGVGNVVITRRLRRSEVVSISPRFRHLGWYRGRRRLPLFWPGLSKLGEDHDACLCYTVSNAAKQMQLMRRLPRKQCRAP